MPNKAPPPTGFRRRGGGGAFKFVLLYYLIELAGILLANKKTPKIRRK
jgi:hypothetical protein